MLHNSVGESLSRMHSKAKSGKSKRETSSLSSTFSTFELTPPMFFNGMKNKGPWNKLIAGLLFLNQDTRKVVNNSPKNQGDKSHEGIGLCVKDWERKMKEKDTQEINK